MGDITIILWVFKTLFWYTWAIFLIVYMAKVADRHIDFERRMQEHDRRLRELGVIK